MVVRPITQFGFIAVDAENEAEALEAAEHQSNCCGRVDWELSTEPSGKAYADEESIEEVEDA